MSGIRNYFVLFLVSLYLIYPTSAFTAQDFIKMATDDVDENWLEDQDTWKVWEREFISND